MSMELSRRSFIKHGIIAGICVYTVPALARFNLNFPVLHMKCNTQGTL